MGSGWFNFSLCPTYPSCSHTCRRAACVGSPYLQHCERDSQMILQSLSFPPLSLPLSTPSSVRFSPPTPAAHVNRVGLKVSIARSRGQQAILGKIIIIIKGETYEEHALRRSFSSVFSRDVARHFARISRMLRINPLTSYVVAMARDQIQNKTKQNCDLKILNVPLLYYFPPCAA